MKEMTEELRKELENSILRLFDSNGNEIVFKTKELKKFKSKYSSTGRASWTLFIDDKPLVNLRVTKIKVEYKCKCGSVHIIHLSKFLAKDLLSCDKCRETEEKRKWHSEILKRLHKGESYTPKRKAKKTTYDFDSETNEFKEKFYKNNLTSDEFNKVKKYIYSVDNVIIEGADVEFIEHDTSENAKKYRQTLVINGVKHPFKRIVLECPICKTTFSITRPIKHRVLSHNFDCKYCYLVNKTFAPRKYNESLTYQSKTELKFIEKCVEKGIEITNGNDVTYEFGGKKRKYRIDFYLPHFRTQVEIKDNHVWHMRQVENGKWQAKENAAKEFCKENDMQFSLLFPTDIDKFFSSLERDSLNNDESH